MSKKSVFTIYVICFTLLLLVLTGCQSGASDPSTIGFFDRYFVNSFSSLIKWVASLLGGNFGMSIILVTISIRLLLLPLILNQSKKAPEAREKMALMKTESEALREKFKNRNDPESERLKKQEMSQLTQKYQFNPLTSMGCLPMIIQLPILIGFYRAIYATPEIALANFLWFNLGEPNIILTVVAVATYFLQFEVSQIGIDPIQQKKMKFMGLLSPLMIGFVSLSAPAALPLYWTVGASFLIFQQLLVKKIYPQKAPVVASAVK